MKLPQQPFDWHLLVHDTFSDMSKQVITHAPKLIAAILLFLLGYLLAHLVRITIKRIVLGFDSLFKRTTQLSDTSQVSVRTSYANIISKTMFWLVILFFLAASSNILGWKLLMSWMSGLISYIPQFLTGLLIILVGILLSHGAKSLVLKFLSGTEIIQAELLARATEVIVIFMAVIMGIEQIGINVHFLTTIITTISTLLLAGLVFAFSLGAKPFFSNIIGAQYALKHFQIGERMKIGGFEGVLVDVTTTTIILETSQGRDIVPGKYFLESVSQFVKKV